MSEKILVEKGGHRRRIMAGRLKSFQRKGYEKVEEPESGLNELTYDELQELAREEDLTGRSGMNKAELSEALEEVI